MCFSKDHLWSQAHWLPSCVSSELYLANWVFIPLFPLMIDRYWSALQDQHWHGATTRRTFLSSRLWSWPHGRCSNTLYCISNVHKRVIYKHVWLYTYHDCPGYFQRPLLKISWTSEDVRGIVTRDWYRSIHGDPYWHVTTPRRACFTHSTVSRGNVDGIGTNLNHYP